MADTIKAEVTARIAHIRLVYGEADRDAALMELLMNQRDYNAEVIEQRNIMLDRANADRAVAVEALQWIAENNDAGDMFYKAPGRFAKRAKAAITKMSGRILD